MRDVPEARWSRRVAWAAMAVGFGLIVAILVCLVRPYDLLTYGDPGPLKTDEFTSKGVPVLRVGDPVTWDQPFCNRGVETYSDRWVDIYGTATKAGFVPNRYKISLRVASFGVPPVVFYADRVGQNECKVSEVAAFIPNYVPPGTYYRFRVDSHYKANAIRTVHVGVETELFLLLGPDDPIP